MNIRNRGAFCSNCGTERNKKNCTPCITRDGKPSWTPMDGIKVSVTHGWSFTRDNKAIPTTFREVLANEMER